LGRNGISFGYFAELERLEERFGTEFVRLCGEGIPVETRRILLRSHRRRRVEGEVRYILGSGSDKRRVDALIHCAARVQSEEELYDAPRRSPNQRVGGYWHHAMKWEDKLAELVEQMEQTPKEFRVGPAYWKLVHAWRVVFKRHVAAGRRLARLYLLPTLHPGHDQFLEMVENAWSSGQLSAYFHRDPPAVDDVA
jgi:hypothetical protein